MLYIWIKYDGVKNYEPHISFEDEDKEDALFEIQTLRDEGIKAKFGNEPYFNKTTIKENTHVRS